MQSKLLLNLNTPSVGNTSQESFSPYKPFTLAGYTFEPAVSVPIAKGANPAAMLTAEPDDDPPAV